MFTYESQARCSKSQHSGGMSNGGATHYSPAGGPCCSETLSAPCLTWTALPWHIAEVSLDYTVVLRWPELCKAVCKKKVRHILTPVSSSSQTPDTNTKAAESPPTETSRWTDTFSFLPSRLLKNAQGDFA